MSGINTIEDRRLILKDRFRAVMGSSPGGGVKDHGQNHSRLSCVVNMHQVPVRRPLLAG